PLRRLAGVALPRGLRAGAGGLPSRERSPSLQCGARKPKTPAQWHRDRAGWDCACASAESRGEAARAGFSCADALRSAVTSGGLRLAEFVPIVDVDRRLHGPPIAAEPGLRHLARRTNAAVDVAHVGLHREEARFGLLLLRRLPEGAPGNGPVLRLLALGRPVLGQECEPHHATNSWREMLVLLAPNVVVPE